LCDASCMSLQPRAGGGASRIERAVAESCCFAVVAGEVAGASPDGQCLLILLLSQGCLCDLHDSSDFPCLNTSSCSLLH
jgi:hypothetical protein